MTGLPCRLGSILSSGALTLAVSWFPSVGSSVLNCVSVHSAPLKALSFGVETCIFLSLFCSAARNMSAGS